MLNQGNQRNVPASRRRLAEALARKLLAHRAKQAAAANTMFANNPGLVQQAQEIPQIPSAMPEPVAAANPQLSALPPQRPTPQRYQPFSKELLDEIDRLPREIPSPFPPSRSKPGASPNRDQPIHPDGRQVLAPAALEELPLATQRQTLDLSPDDIKILKKVLSTEAVAGLPPEIYRQQAAGIVDTILNRRVHGKWGDSIEAVVNAPYQFSDINGPVAWRRGRRNVHQIADDTLNSGAGLLASQFVDEYLARRAAGEPSSVGGHLNYANPHYSDASNLSWIRKLDGPRFGQGQAVHWHGTAQGLTPVDPNYAVRVAGQGQLPAAFGVEALLQQALMPNASSPQQPRSQVHPAILEALMRNANP